MIAAIIIGFLIMLSIVCIAWAVFMTVQVLNKTNTCPVNTCPAPTCPVNTCPICPQTSQSSQSIQSNQDSIGERDRRVNSDPMYPPLGRGASLVTQATRDSPIVRQHIYSNPPTDSYRLVGYMVSDESSGSLGDNSWKLYAKDSATNRNRSEFYAASTNKNIDMKIMITNDMIVGSDKLRDIYSIPEQITIKHPMFSSSSYQIVQLQSGDVGDRYY